MSATVFSGKFNYAPYASNENFFVTFVNGWVERGQVLIYSTWTQDGNGVLKAPIVLAPQYVLISQNQFMNTFILDDLSKSSYYWFNGARNSDGTITLNMVTGTSPTLATITLNPLPN